MTSLKNNFNYQNFLFTSEDQIREQLIQRIEYMETVFLDLRILSPDYKRFGKNQISNFEEREIVVRIGSDLDSETG
jgi:hypothetical protein